MYPGKMAKFDRNWMWENPVREMSELKEPNRYDRYAIDYVAISKVDNPNRYSYYGKPSLGCRAVLKEDPEAHTKITMLERANRTVSECGE